MIIECENCGNSYDIDIHDYCPNCGDYNEDLIKDIEE